VKSEKNEILPAIHYSVINNFMKVMANSSKNEFTCHKKMLCELTHYVVFVYNIMTSFY